MKKRLFILLIAAILLCALAGCNNAKPDDKDTPATTTTQTQQETAPLTLMEGEAPEGSYWHVDDTVDSTNYTVALKANVDLTDLCFLQLGADDPVVEQTLHVQTVLNEGDYWAIETYLNDAVPNRGVACTDKDGKVYYYAIACSMKGDNSPSLSLTALNIAALSKERLNEIETMLNEKENNGFVSMNSYSCPEEVSLSWALYDGADIGVGSWEWTDEEVQEYIDAIGWEEMYISVIRFARADVEALLQEKLGISIADLTSDIDLPYNEKYDVYYHAHTDSSYQTVEVLHGWLEGGEGGLYVVDYKIGAMDGMGRVTLKLTKDGYQFVSNQEIKPF